MHLSPTEVATVRTAAALHDIGKILTPPEILNKAGALTEQEFEVVKRHPVDGADMLAGIGDADVTAMVRHHHERLDGAGYPDGLVGEQIPLGARIIAVADTFDAMTSQRAYHGATNHKRALDVLSEEAGAQPRRRRGLRLPRLLLGTDLGGVVGAGDRGAPAVPRLARQRLRARGRRRGSVCPPAGPRSCSFSRCRRKARPFASPRRRPASAKPPCRRTSRDAPSRRRAGSARRGEPRAPCRAPGRRRVSVSDPGLRMAPGDRSPFGAPPRPQ